MPVRLSTTLSKISSVPNNTNVSLLAKLYTFMQTTGASESHCNNTLKSATAFAYFLGPAQSFYDITTKDQITIYLDTKMKNSEIDPEKRWITTWNDYLGDLKYLFRWLHNYKLKINQGLEANSTPSEWETPAFVQIKKKKTKRLSPYSQSEIWDLEELKAIIKYEPNKRNKAAIALMWDLNTRNHELTMLKLKHVRLLERYAEGEIPHQAKTGSGPILLTFSFPYVRDWLNEHPFRNTPEARLICNLINGAPIKPEALWTMMKQLRMRISRLIETGTITNEGEKEKLRVLLSTKKFNPYCFRHSSISHDSDFLPDYALKKKVRWSMNSKQPSRYIKARLSDDLKNTILIHNGIISEDEGGRRSTMLECGRCQTVNTIDSKYCVRCSYPLTPSAFDEIKEQEDSKYRLLEKRFDAMQSMVEKLALTVTKVADPTQQTELVKSMFNSGLLKVSKSVSSTN